MRGLDALLLGGHHIQRQNRQHRAVHGHRHRHLVERNAVEQLTHVEDRVDGHAGHTDVTGDPRVIRVVAAVGRQIECDRQALLACGQVAAVEGIGLGGSGETGVLTDRPRTRGVHGRIRTTQERRHTGEGMQMIHAFVHVTAIEMLDIDLFRRGPVDGALRVQDRVEGSLSVRSYCWGPQFDLVETRQGVHLFTPRVFKTSFKPATTSMPKAIVPSMSPAVSTFPSSLMLPASSTLAAPASFKAFAASTPMDP
ncbi:hypothetical protein SDC9_156165 [bioreactor metagenome]|uniref:Uncharacterized protein n=1 Tax=bioreactor metagenome TaxID=1076179 RepID=A0A645F626_9ZZZZ